MIEYLNSCKSNFGTAPRRFSLWSRYKYLRLERPDWLAQIPDDRISLIFNQFSDVLRNGRVVWGQVIQANQLLFSEGEDDCPGELLYSLEDPMKVDPGYLQQLASKLFSLKGTMPDHQELAPIANYLTDERIRVYGLEVPRVLSPNLKCRISTAFFVRKHLPNQRLASTFLPIVVSATEPLVVTPLPERYWPESLKELWG